MRFGNDEVATICDLETARKTIRVLLIEDDPDYARLVTARLQIVSTIATDLHHATNLGDGLAQIHGSAFDVVLLDLSLPDGHGLENVSEVLAVTKSVPVIVLTALDDEHLATEALKLGAQDYLVKALIDTPMLVKSIRHAMQRQRLVDELNRARQTENEVKEKFFSHVSHELRTPLTAVFQFTTILQDGLAGDLNDRQVEYLGIIRRNCEQLKRMISTLMDATRADSGKLTFQMELVELSGILDGAIETLGATAIEKRLDVSLTAPAKNSPILADRTRITQVVSNLISNAIKFTPEAGRISVTLTEDPERPRFLRVTVKDTGCGIPEESLPHVFDRMYQVETPSTMSRKGLGLGLHICREIVKHHDGEIWAESDFGKGSSFHFSLPVYSLLEVLRRVADVEGAQRSTVALIVVELEPREPVARAKGPHAAVQEVVRVLERCLLGVSDAVLPTRVVGEKGAVFALARTDAAGALVIETRAREELGRNARLGVWGFDMTVSSQPFEILNCGGSDGNTAMEDTSRRLQTTMNSIAKGTN